MLLQVLPCSPAVAATSLPLLSSIILQKGVTGLDDIIKKLNDSSLANSVLGTYSDYDRQKCLNAVKNQLNGTKLLASIEGLKDVEVDDAYLSSETKDGKTIYFIAAYLKKAEKKTVIK